MAGHPANVRGAPVRILVFEIEDPFRGQMRLQQITGRCVQDSFRLSRRSRGVQNEQWVLAIEFCGSAGNVHSLHQLVPPVIASGFHCDF